MDFSADWLFQEIKPEDDLDYYCRMEGVNRFTPGRNSGRSEVHFTQRYPSLLQHLSSMIW